MYLLARDAYSVPTISLAYMCSENEQTDNRLASVSADVDDAVGVPEAKWFIAIVNNHSEKSTAEKLTKMGVENYLPTQNEIRVWRTGKRVNVDKVLIPAKIFIRCSEQERRKLVYLPIINRFMTNIAGAHDASSNRPLAVVPEDQIEKLKFMLGASDGDVVFSEHFAKGQRIEVVRGPLRGLVGEITEDADSGVSHLFVNISCLGCASVIINPKDVRQLNDNDRH